MLPVSVSIHQVKPGMIVADDVYSSSGQFVVSKNTVLNPRHISKMRLYNVKSLYVLISEGLISEESEAEDDHKHQNPLRSTTEFKVFRRAFVNTATELATAFETIMQQPNTKIDFDPIVAQVINIANSVHGTLLLMEFLHCMREYDDTIYIHSISVALVAHTIAARAKLSETEVNELMLSCILHDIGKLRIPQYILSKPTKLTEEEYSIIKQHSQHGYDMLKNAHLPDQILLAVLLHHERCDGSGYPSGLYGSKIPLYPKIIAIADVYDAMTAKRVYRKEICSFDVIAMFEQDGYQKYDANLLLPFLENIAQSHVNAQVRLSNSLIGTIVMINQHKLSRPIVNVDGQFYDLSKQSSTTIVRIL